MHNLLLLHIFTMNRTLELSASMQEYKIGLTEHECKLRDDWERKSEKNMEQTIFDERRAKWLEAHPSFKEQPGKR